MDTQDKNYFLFVPSRLIDSPKTIRYQIDGKDAEYVGMQTNEAVTKYLAEYLHTGGKKLDKIIMLCTKEVMEEKIPAVGGITTLDYYRQTVHTYLSEQEELAQEYGDLDGLFEIIPYAASDYEVNEINRRLKEVIGIPESGADLSGKHLYVDFTGGPRSAALTLVFTCRILQLNGVKVEKILYSNIIGFGGNRIGKIEECTEVYRLFDMLEAKEALAYGDFGKMIRHLNEKGDEELKEALVRLANSCTDREMAVQMNQFITAVSASEGILKDADRIAGMEGSVEASVIASGIKEQVNASRNMVENAQYKELVNIEEFLEKKNYDKAISLFREKIIKIMIDLGILKGGSDQRNYEAEVTNELMGAYCYYEKSAKYKRSFWDAVRDYVEALNRNPEKDPLAILQVRNAKLYDLREYRNQIPRWGFAHDGFGVSQSICNEKIIPYLEADERGTSNPLTMLERYQQLERIYMGHGFPFACTYGNSYFYEDYEALYRANMEQGATSLHNYFQGVADERMARVLTCFPEETFTYRTLIRALHKKQNEKMLRILFPFQLSRKNIDSDRIKGEKWEEFVYDFARSFYSVKQVRNKVTHPDDLKRAEFDQAIQTMKRVIGRIKEIAEEQKKQT